MEVTQQDVCEKLIFPLFRCLDENYKKKYLKNIWEQFENNIRAAAYTSSLKKFLENVTRSMAIDLQRKYGDGVIEIIGCGFDEDILTWIRTETTYMVLVARSLNEERKEVLKPQMDMFSAQEAVTNSNNSISEQDELTGIL